MVSHFLHWRLVPLTSPLNSVSSLPHFFFKDALKKGSSLELTADLSHATTSTVPTACETVANPHCGHFSLPFRVAITLPDLTDILFVDNTPLSFLHYTPPVSSHLSLPKH